MKELIFLLNDALGRLADLKAVQDEMADEETWAKQPEKTRKDREHAAAVLQSTAKGFLSLAKASLNALLFLTRDGQACAAFTSVASRAKKMAALLYKFFDTLCGPAMSTLKVKEKEKVGWNPQEMLRNTAQLLLQCATHTPQMVSTFAAVDGFDASLLPKARRILAEVQLPPHQTEQLDAIVATLHSGSGGGGGASSSADGEGAGGEGRRRWRRCSPRWRRRRRRRRRARGAGGAARERERRVHRRARGPHLFCGGRDAGERFGGERDGAVPPPLPPEHFRHAVRDDEPREGEAAQPRAQGLGEAGDAPRRRRGLRVRRQGRGALRRPRCSSPARRTSTT